MKLRWALWQLTGHLGWDQSSSLPSPEAAAHVASQGILPFPSMVNLHFS